MCHRENCGAMWANRCNRLITRKTKNLTLCTRKRAKCACAVRWIREWKVEAITPTAWLTREMSLSACAWSFASFQAAVSQPPPSLHFLESFATELFFLFSLSVSLLAQHYWPFVYNCLLHGVCLCGLITQIIHYIHLTSLKPSNHTQARQTNVHPVRLSIGA